MMPEIAGIGVVAAFLAGTVSFLSPCVLPLVPGYVSYVAGRSLDDVTRGAELGVRLSVIGLSFAFVLGFSFVFVALGAAASAVGELLMSYRFEANYVAGALIILFGLHMMGLLRLRWLNRDLRFTPQIPGGRPFGAFVLGTAFAFGWTPCIGPVLGGILTVSATTMEVADGAALLSIYSLGLAVPFLLVAAFTGQFVRWTRSARWLGRPLQGFAGAVLIVTGVAMVTGYLNAFGTWLLLTFPIFQQLTL